MKYLIAIPCMDMMHTQFVRSLTAMLGGGQVPGQVELTFSQSSLIYDARNQLAGKAVSQGFDRVLWLDSDMTYKPDLMARLAARLDEGRDFCSGLYMKRKAPIEPCVWQHGDLQHIVVESYLEYPRDDIFEIAACGFGAVMMTVDLIRCIGDNFGFPFSPALGLGEDLSFCYRARELGYKLWCDSTIKLGHIGQLEINEQTFIREQARMKGD